MLKTIDLFAGAGGLSLGFHRTGKVQVVAAAEINRNAAKTYKKNFQKDNNSIEMIENVIGYDFRSLVEKYGAIDLVIGGPPCQGFSNANRQKNHVISMNNKLIKEYFRAIKELQPKAFVMENVSMLQSDTHRFYDSLIDHDEVVIYDSIKMRSDRIVIASADIADEKKDILEIIGNEQTLKENMIPEKLFARLNILYKNRNDPKRLPQFIKVNKTTIINLIRSALNAQITDYNRAQLQIVLTTLEQDTYRAQNCEIALSNLVALQKSLRNAQEIYDNKLIHTFERQKDGTLIAKVTSYSVIDYVDAILGDTYRQVGATVNALWFGVPQERRRYITMGIRADVLGDKEFEMLGEPDNYSIVTVEDAIFDLKEFETSDKKDSPPIAIPVPGAKTSGYAKKMRDSNQLHNHIATASTPEAIERFKAIPEGKNFHCLSKKLKESYAKPERTQNTIYLRLNRKAPSGTVVNVRKSMWIHPELHRAISVREAARLQSFPDSFVFYGTKDSQYQQVGNAVPPMLAQAIAEHILEYL